MFHKWFWGHFLYILFSRFSNYHWLMTTTKYSTPTINYNAKQILHFHFYSILEMPYFLLFIFLIKWNLLFKFLNGKLCFIWLKRKKADPLVKYSLHMENSKRNILRKKWDWRIFLYVLWRFKLLADLQSHSSCIKTFLPLTKMWKA